jgi:hypothetical protein
MEDQDRSSKNMNDARENYKAVFGVYPNERNQPHAEPPNLDRTRKLALTLESAASDLLTVWDQSQFAGVSPQAQELLRQIQAAAGALRREIAKPAAVC